MAANNLNVAFVNLTQQLGPSETSKKYGNEWMDTIFNLIKAKSSFKYDRIRVIGGFKQKTSCWAKMDYDCVLFVNNDDFWRRAKLSHTFSPSSKSKFNVLEELEHFQNNVLNDWKTFLEKELDKYAIRVTFTDSNKRCLLEWMNEGLSADLLVGLNAIQSGQQSADKQTHSMLRLLTKIPDEEDRIRTACSITFSASLTERPVEYMEGKHSIHHEMARLAKFWTLLCCPNPTKIPCQSALIALIAVDSCRLEQNHVENFKNFLNRMICYHDIVIDNSLEFPGLGKLAGKPRVLDAGNPYNNLMQATDTAKNKAIRVFFDLCKQKAMETIRLIDQRNYSGDWKAFIDIFSVRSSFKDHQLDSYVRDPKWSFAFEDAANLPFPMFNRSRGNSDRKDEELRKVLCCLASLCPRCHPKGEKKTISEIREDFKNLITTATGLGFGVKDSAEITIQIPF